METLTWNGKGDSHHQKLDGKKERCIRHKSVSGVRKIKMFILKNAECSRERTVYAKTWSERWRECDGFE